MINPTALNTEMTTDPLSLGYASLIAAGADGAIADILNDTTKGTPMPQPITVAQLRKFGVANALYGLISQAAATPTHPAYNACLALVDAFKAPAGDPVDMSDPALTGATVNGTYVPGLLDLLLVNDGTHPPVMTSAQKTALITLATKPASRGYNLFGFGVVVQHGDVARAFGR